MNILVMHQYRCIFSLIFLKVYNGREVVISTSKGWAWHVVQEPLFLCFKIKKYNFVPNSAYILQYKSIVDIQLQNLAWRDSVYFS